MLSATANTLNNTQSPAPVSYLRASLRVSTIFTPRPSGGVVQAHRNRRASRGDQASAVYEQLSFSDDDLVDLDPEERAVANAGSPPLSPNAVTSPTTRARPILAGPRRSITRIASLTRHSRRRASQSPPPNEHIFSPGGSSQRASVVDNNTLILPQFPLTLSSPLDQLVSDTRAGSLEIVSVGASAPKLYDTDPFYKGKASIEGTFQPKLIPVSPLRVIQEVVDPNLIAPSPPSTRVASPTTITPSLAISTVGLNPFQKTLQRLRSLRGRALVPHFILAPEISQVLPPTTQDEATSPYASGYPQLLPELSFDLTPLADLVFSVHVSEDAVAYQEPCDFGSSHLPLPVPPPASIETQRDQGLQLVKWERVDPKDLNPSPFTTADSDIWPAETPLLIPEPAWLSRNVFDLEVSRKAAVHSARYFTPPSPAPLPILPRSLLPPRVFASTPEVCSYNIPVSNTDQSPSDDSSVTLYTPARPILRISPPTPFGSPNRLSVLPYRKTPSESRRSLQSFLSYASVAITNNKENPLISISQDSPSSRFFLLLHSQSVEPSPIDSTPSPLPLPIKLSFEPADPSYATVDQFDSEDYQVFRPSPEAFEASEDTFPLPNYLRALIRSTNRNSRNYVNLNMSAPAYGKPADTVDWGDEVDYSQYEWFKNPPSPRPQPPTPPPLSEPYVPQPGVIEQNEIFDYALKSAPNVLFGRFKQYGQLGVLAWCSEFGEMIDALKALGFEGNMFVSTRTQALKACEDILGMNLNEEIEMQIIVMYLSSQIARLRRFLDSDAVFDDYPQPKFPIDPHAH